MLLLTLFAGCGSQNSRVANVRTPSPSPAGASSAATQSDLSGSIDGGVIDTGGFPQTPPIVTLRPSRSHRPPTAVLPLTLIISLKTDGSQVLGTADSALEQGSAAISADGSYVAFASNSATFVTGDTNTNFDVFVRKTCLTAAAGCTPTTTRVSLAADGSELPGGGSTASISADGRYVAFGSIDTSIDHNAHIFIRDTCLGAAAGCTPTTLLGSRANDGSVPNYFDYSPRISKDGRYLAFGSRATNLVPGSANDYGDIYLRDTCLGASPSCTPSTVRIDAAPDGSPSNNYGANIFDMSADGRYVAFLSNASNLVPNDNNNINDIFVRDTCAGATSCIPATTLVSVDSDGKPLTMMNTVGNPAISANGRYVVFSSSSELLPSSASINPDIFMRDTCAGATEPCLPSTTKVSPTYNGFLPDGSSYYPSVSADGRYVAFVSSSTNLVPNNALNTGGVYVRDTCAGVESCQPETALLSTSSSGVVANAASSNPAISSDGHWVAFDSTATNLVPNDTNAAPDVFVARVPF